MATGGETDPHGPSDPGSMDVYYTAERVRYTTIAKDTIEDDQIACFLSARAKFLYVLPGFDVLVVELHHLKVKGFGKIGSEEEVYDLFAKNDASLCRTYPAAMIVKDLTIVKVNYGPLPICIS